MGALRLGQRLSERYKGAVEADAGGADSPPTRLRPFRCGRSEFQASVLGAVS